MAAAPVKHKSDASVAGLIQFAVDICEFVGTCETKYGTMCQLITDFHVFGSRKSISVTKHRAVALWFRRITSGLEEIAEITSDFPPQRGRLASPRGGWSRPRPSRSLCRASALRSLAYVYPPVGFLTMRENEGMSPSANCVLRVAL